MTTTHLSLEKYLRTDYEPDCDYVDGKLEERNTGEIEHSAVLGFFVSATTLRNRVRRLPGDPDSCLAHPGTRR